MKTLIAVLALCLPPGLAAAQSEAQKPKPKPEAEGRIEKPKADGPVLEITRVSRPGCEIKPVMTDEEIERCRRAAYERQ